MSGVGAVGASNGPVAAEAAGVAGPQAGAGALMPPPAEGMLPNDPMSFLYMAEAQDRKLNLELGAKRANGLQKERHDKIAELQKAIQDAIEASQKKSFWDDIGDICGKVAKVAAVVASVAAAVATAGAATPIAALAIAGATMSAASFVDSEAHILEKLGVDPKVAGWIDTGLAVGSIVCSGGASLLASGTAAANGAKALQVGTSVVAGAGEIGQGAAKMASADAKYDEDQAVADQVKAQAQTRQLQRLMLMLQDNLKGDEEQAQRTLGHIRNIKTTQAETLVASVSVRV